MFKKGLMIQNEFKTHFINQINIFLQRQYYKLENIEWVSNRIILHTNKQFTTKHTFSNRNHFDFQTMFLINNMTLDVKFENRF